MKRWRNEDFWFELTTGPDPTNGRPVRYHIIRCACGQESSRHAHGMSVEKLRKYFVRRGWQIGKTSNAHRCPDCQQQQKPEQKPATPMVFVSNEIYHHWSEADRAERLIFLRLVTRAWTNEGQERQEFLALLGEIGIFDEMAVKILAEFEARALTRPAPEPAPSTPEPALEPEPVAESEPEPEPEPAIEQDDTPADWWLEATSKKEKAA